MSCTTAARARAVDVDEAGRLVVQEDGGGARRVFTGEVSVRGIYGAVEFRV